jgi:aspartate carbamoyltransferase (EC 2.1.3.2)
MATAPWTRRHILSLADFMATEYNTILQTATSFREVLGRRNQKSSRPPRSGGGKFIF